MAAILRLFVTMISLATRILLKLRLGVPLLYIILMVTVFKEWAAMHNALSVGILIALVAVVFIGRVASFVRKVRAF